MLYLLWGLLNIGLFIFFIFICVRATKLIREKLGLFASFIFVFGLLSFVGRSNANIGNRGPNSNETKIWNFNTEDRLEKNSTSSIYLDLEKTLTSRYELSIKYGQDSIRNATFL